MKIFLLIVITTSALTSFSQPTKVVKLDQLQALMEDRSHSIQVINFWATWCAPCVKELPLFERLNNENNKELNVTLVSMDLDLDPKPDKVYKFIERKKIKSKVILLDENDPNSYIDKIDKQWSGALPATLIINTKTGHRKFIEKELHEGELEKLIRELK
ncbi:TlpA family protein disulfide reductase [Chryseosolibacter indicus]|uniref:TlpA family protein disulfide reductase n=1 Tax=Chryseosolibacter indicus TaxID=2782351 RepID=A0ABS5VY91_9BACT|nr:TlpA family protein disulfide reductase [Chryseosolibacter indicus]MBT1706365.1 TlpA family protein disulfide reductase [Chryseosolibacter indicus]